MTSYELAACPACNERHARVVADREQIERQLESLWEFHTRRLHAGAPVHQLFDRAIFSQSPPLHVVQCTSCGTVYRNPRESETAILETYVSEEPKPEALASLFDEQLAFFKPRVRKLTGMQGRTGSVLEVGSYLGAFLIAAQEAGWSAHGIDVNESANAFARQRGAAVTSQTLEALEANGSYDAVALWNCFDQLPDPQAALTRVRALLKDSGALAIRVPNGACYARLVAQNGRLSRAALAWNNLASFPYRQGFTPDSLARMLERNGFVVRDTVLDTLVPISGSWTRRWARWEERVVKAGMRPLLTKTNAPWFEIYALMQ